MSENCKTFTNLLNEIAEAEPEQAGFLREAWEILPEWYREYVGDPTAAVAINFVEGEDVLSPSCPNNIPDNAQRELN